MKSKIINGFFVAVIAASFVVLLNMFFTCRSLWLDEGMLAWSVTQRGLATLISEPLDWMQSAPVLYLYIVKIITVIFGNTELTLRVFSVFCYCALIIITYFLGKEFKYPLAFCAFVSSTSLVMRYANEFKPYISDCMSVALVLLLYKLYRESRLSLIPLTIIFCILIWFSNPTCFFIAAILIYEFFKSPKKIILPGICCFLSFAAYFIVWLYPVIAKGDMTLWWEGQYFPLIPTAKIDFHRMYLMFMEISEGVGIPHIGISLFAVFAFIKNLIKDKNPVINVIFLAVFITLFASYLQFYPIERRLWLFIYPVIAYLAFYFVDSAGSSTLILSLAMLFSTTGIGYYLVTDNIYYRNQELNPIIEYVNTKDDFIYVYNDSVPTFCYRNNYDVQSNVLLGNRYFDRYNPDLDKIKQHEHGYIVISNQTGNLAEGLFSGLEDDGYNITVAMEVHETKLYYFSKEQNDGGF